jgi:hypothetical protein
VRAGIAAVGMLAAGWSLVLVAREAAAQDGLLTGMQAGVESVFSSAVTTITFASGSVTKTTTTNVNPVFTVNMSGLLYPSLKLNAGGVFEINRPSIRGPEFSTHSTITRNRPFFILQSTNPVLAPSIGYYRREAVDRTHGLTAVKLVNDEYSASLRWRPDGGFRTDVQFLKTSTFDGDRSIQDLGRDIGTVVSQFNRGDLGLYYRGSFVRNDDRLGHLATRQLSNALRADYSRSFFAKRIVWNGSGAVNHDDFRTAARGAGGEVPFPVIAFGGLAAVSDVPVSARLSPNPALVDGNFAAGSGINLGLPASPADAALRNIGVDLLTPTEVNRFLVWVDRELPIEVSGTFSWDVYSSPDNITWIRQATVSMAPFGAFENRFEIDFPSVTARYLKLVTRPLAVVVPNASQFQTIQVTELQAFIRRRASDVDGRVVQDRYLVNTDIRMRILDAPALYYEGFYLANGTNGLRATTDTLSNGVSVSHAFGRIVSAYGRVAQEQGRQVQGERTATVSSGTFTVEPLPTLRTSLLYTGQTERLAGQASSRWGAFVQNSARPYRGIDVQVGFGWTFTSRDTGEMLRDRLANLTATIVPRTNLSITVNYDLTATRRSGAFTGDARTLKHRSYAAVVIDPIRTLHLLLGGEVIATTGEKTRTTVDVGTSWTPFPDGTLQVVLAYNEAIRALTFGKERNLLTAVRWNLSRTSYIDVSYQRTRTASDFLVADSRTLTARVRLFL